MRGTQIHIYQSWEDLGHTRCTERELLDDLRRFSRGSVLWTCSYINTFLRLWETNSEDISAYLDILRHFYSLAFVHKMWAGYYEAGPKHFVFHRRQLLYLSKLAIAHCSTNGLDAGVPVNGFGVTLLKANDLLHFNLIPEEPLDSYSSASLAKFIAELLAINEYSQHVGPEKFTRAYKLFVDIPSNLQTHHDFIDIEASLQESLGLDYSDIFSITLALAARYFSLKRETVDKYPFQLAIPADYLSSTSIPEKKVRQFLNLASSSSSTLKDQASLNELSNDLTIFRQSPLIQHWFGVGTYHQKIGYLPIDIEFLMDKTYTEPFWFLFRKHGTKFSRFWGAVFETYVNNLLTKAQFSKGSRFIPNPASPLNQDEELCDGVIVGHDSIVLIESKAALLRADVKYSGDASAIEAHLKDKFVCRLEDKKQKGVMQLVNAAKALFGRGAIPVKWADLRNVKKCYLLLVTLDQIGNAICFSTFLQTFVEAQLLPSEFPNVEILPVFCIDIETLERTLPSLRLHSLSEILNRWYTCNPLRSMPLSAISMGDWLANVEPSDKEEWTKMSRKAIEHLGIKPDASFSIS